jgi:hypothetical protein
MKEFNELLERLNNHKATPSDEFFTFFLIIGLPIVLVCVSWLIKLTIEEIKLYRSKRVRS